MLCEAFHRLCNVRDDLHGRMWAFPKGEALNWRAPAVLATLALTGCVLTPAEVIEKGTRQTASSRLAPRDVAACIGKNAESVTRSATTVAYPTGRRDFEVVLQYPDVGAAAVSRFSGTMLYQRCMVGKISRTRRISTRTGLMASTPSRTRGTAARSCFSWFYHAHWRRLELQILCPP